MKTLQKRTEQKISGFELDLDYLEKRKAYYEALSKKQQMTADRAGEATREKRARIEKLKTKPNTETKIAEMELSIKYSSTTQARYQTLSKKQQTTADRAGEAIREKRARIEKLKTKLQDIKSKKQKTK